MSNNENSENRHKLKYVHLTYKGHYQLPVPKDWQFEFLFYCYENGKNQKDQEEKKENQIIQADDYQDGDQDQDDNEDEKEQMTQMLQEKEQQKGTPHTHMGIQLIKGITRKSIIKQLSPWLQVPCQLNVSTHRNFRTIIGYHTGFGNKPPCDKANFIVAYPPNFDVAEYCKNRLVHSKTNNTEARKAQNELILQNSMKSLVKQGLIHIRQFTAINNAKNSFLQMDDTEEFAKKPDLPNFIEIPGQINTKGEPLMLSCNFKVKKRHYWIKGPPNSGKTTLGHNLLQKFRAARTEHDQGSFEDVYKGTQLLIMDAIQPDNKPPLSDLERLCDGSKKLKIKYLGPKQIGIVIVIILSNYALKEIYFNDIRGILDVRFNEIHLTKTFADADVTQENEEKEAIKMTLEQN